MSGDKKVTATSTRAAFWRQLPLGLGLVLLWLLLWDEITLVNVLTGVVVAVVVLLLFYLPPIELGGRIDIPRAIVFFARLFLDIAVASLAVAGEALAVWRQPRSSIIKIHLHTRSDLVLTFTAQATSLVPGSLVVEVDREHSALFLHVLSTPDHKALDTARRRVLATERRIVLAVGSHADVEALRAEDRGRGTAL